MTPPLISFVIPVRDDAVRLGQCLEAIAGNDTAVPVELIVADNGSHDASTDVAAAYGATVLSLPGLSVAALRNAGAAVARGDLLAFIDADHLLDCRWISHASDVFSDRSVAAAGAPCEPPAQANAVQRAYDRFRVRRSGAHDVAWLGSGNLLVRRSVFEAVGRFDTTLETCEDVDLCNRLRAAGCRIVSDSRLRSVHQGDPATLRALFFGELWRGRDNLRVTLRGPWTPRALASLIIPAIGLAAIASTAAGVTLVPLVGTSVALAGVAAFALITLIQFVRVSGPRLAPADFGVTFVVVAVYHAGRSLALLCRVTHTTRRPSLPGTARA